MTQARLTSKRKKWGIYTTQQDNNLLFAKVKVNGRLCAAYVKGNQLISYIPVGELFEQFHNAECLEFTTT